MADFCYVKKDSKDLILNDNVRPMFKLFRKINLGHEAAKHKML